MRVEDVRASAAGLTGTLRVSYQVAAALGPWSLVLAPRLPRTYELTATVERWDAFWRTRRPLTLALQLAGGLVIWEWPHVDPTSEGDTIVTFTLLGMPTIIRHATTPATQAPTGVTR
jgi:hypothetical protein